MSRSKVSMVMDSGSGMEGPSAEGTRMLDRRNRRRRVRKSSRESKDQARARINTATEV